MRGVRLLFIMVVVCLGIAQAQAIGFVGGGTAGLSYPKDNTSTAYSFALSLGGGLGVQLPIKRFMLEPELMYKPRKFSVGETTATVSYFEIPVLLFFSIWPSLSVGAGFFGSYALDEISRTGALTSALTLEQASMRSYTGGFVASVRGYLFSASTVSLFVDSRYMQSLINPATHGKITLRDFVLFIGLRVGKAGK